MAFYACFELCFTTLAIKLYLKKVFVRSEEKVLFQTILDKNFLHEFNPQPAI